jgi:hypothetical protein
MRQRIIDSLSREVGDADTLSPVHREQFLVYIMGPYRTFDIETMGFGESLAGAGMDR